LITHDIELEEGGKAFRDQVRRQNPEKRKSSEDQIIALAEEGMITPSHSPFSSGIVMVKKSDGTFRLCVDFRKLNEITKKDAFPLPRIDDTIERLGSARYFSSLDMGNAFWQVPLTKTAQEKTAFASNTGLWEWKRMPFGLCNATATFQRLMTKMLGKVIQKYGNLVLCYVDDILIASTTIEEHLERLREVFKCIRMAGLKLKAQKCRLFDTEIRFLGRKITAEGIQPDPENVEKVHSWKAPRNKDEIGYFLGFANYYREFVKDYATITAPIQKLKKKDVAFVWTEVEQEAFDMLKIALTSTPILAMPTETGDFVLDTDASVVAIAGILHQWQSIEGK
jgi:hypothetical protein